MSQNRPARGFRLQGLSLDRLRTAEFLQGLSDQDLQLVSSKASAREIPRGTILFRQAEPAGEMFLLESGRVRLGELTAEGHDVLVRFIVPGDVFGGRGAFAGAKYGGWARTDQASRVISWTNTTTQDLLKRIPRLASNLAGIISRYLRYSRERYQLLKTNRVERRVAWALTDLARSIGRREGNATVIRAAAIQKDVADLAGTTIYSVSRVLSELQRRGILTKERGRILLHGEKSSQAWHRYS